MYRLASPVLLNRYEHSSALPASIASEVDPGSRTDLTGDTEAPETIRETKIKCLLNADSPRLAKDAIEEACLLAPLSLYLGQKYRGDLMRHFKKIAQLLEMERSAERVTASYESNNCSVEYGKGFWGEGESHSGAGFRGVVNNGHGGSTSTCEVFEAYKQILEAPDASSSWSTTDVRRLDRMRRIAEPAAAKVVGARVADEAMRTVWKEAKLHSVIM